MNHWLRALLASGLAASMLSGCGGSGGSFVQSETPLQHLSKTGAGKIQHIVFIVQENRSFNNLFMGYPGAKTADKGRISNGQVVKLQPVSLAYQYVIDHSAYAMFSACHAPPGDLPGTHCQMNGFDQEGNFGGPQGVQYPEYVYAPRKDTKPYWDMAHEWVLGDHMFQSHLDESFVSHQYIIAAQAGGAVDLPYGLWGCPGGKSDEVPVLNQQRQISGYETPCWDYTTLGDELDNASLTWKFYTSKYGSPSSGDGSWWSSYQAVNHIYNGPDWKNDIVTPQKQFLKDVPDGKLANFTWITPVCNDSDHVNCGGGYGPSWVAAIVNAVGQSKFWDSTAIFVMWDDWGGLYDPVKPPFEDYDGVGFRVPLLVISPYAKQNYVSHVQYETTSVLRFAEDLWGLPQMAAADKRANSPAADCFDFNQAPRKFKKIRAPKYRGFFMQQPMDYRAPDYQ
jgi:phospholipase C